MKATFSIRKIPLLPFLLALAIGILIQNYFAFNLKIILVALGSFIAIFFSASLLPFRCRHKLRHAPEGLLLLSFVALGSLLLYKSNIKNDKRFVENYHNIKAYLIVLNEPLSVKPKSYKSVGSIEKIFVDGKWKTAKGNMFLYFKKDSIHNQLQNGSQIIITKPLQAIRNEGNPGEFNFATYCHRKGIYFQQYLKDKDYLLLKENKANWFMRDTDKTREYIFNSINKNIADSTAQNLAKALLLGNRSALDKDVVQSFSDAGIIIL